MIGLGCIGEKVVVAVAPIMGKKVRALS